MTVHLAAAALGAVAGAAAGGLVPELIRHLPEPPVKDEAPVDVPPVDVPPDDVPPLTQEPTRPPPTPLTLWGMRPDDGTKELYADMARVRGLRTGSVVACALVGALLGARFDLVWALLGLVPLVPLGVAVAVVDWRTRLIPTRLVLPGTAVVVLLGVLAWVSLDAGRGLQRGLIGLVIARSFFWVLWFVRRAGMGFGDVRLAALLGFTLAYLGWGEFVVGLYAGFLVFSVPGVALALVRRDRRLMKQAFPYGPFMLLGALFGILLGGQIARGLAG